MAAKSGQKQRVHAGFKKPLNSQKRWKCSLCDKLFENFFALHEHRRTHTGQTPWKCDCCGKSFQTSTHLTQHKRIHSGESPYECDICGKSFVRPQTRDKHRSSRHGENQTDEYDSNGKRSRRKTCKCDVCDRPFHNLQGLAQHKMIHTGEKPWKCRYCERSFRHRSVLSKHEMRHSGEKPYKCEICGKRFIQFSCLKRHRITHHGECAPEKAPCKCELCGKLFTLQGDLNRHYRKKIPCKRSRTEIPFDESCVFVLRKLANDPESTNRTLLNGSEKQMLPIKSVSIEKWNNGGRPNQNESSDTCVNTNSDQNIWKCDYCDIVLPQPNELSVHTLLMHIEHVQDNAFKCDWCGKVFFQSIYLTAHRVYHVH